MPLASLSGSVSMRARDLDRGVADGQTRAGLEIEPRQQRRVDGGAERAVALRQRVGERHAGIERDRRRSSG